MQNFFAQVLAIVFSKYPHQFYWYSYLSGDFSKATKPHLKPPSQTYLLSNLSFPEINHCYKAI